MTIEPDLMRSLAALSQPHPAEAERNNKPDMRESRSRKLKAVCHPSHIEHKFERRTSKYGSYRDFTSGAFCRALQLKDVEFEELITALAVAKKMIN